GALKACRGDDLEGEDAHGGSGVISLLLERFGEGFDLGELALFSANDQRVAGVIAENDDRTRVDAAALVLRRVKIAEGLGDLRGLAAGERDDVDLGELDEVGDIDLLDEGLDA